MTAIIWLFFLIVNVWAIYWYVQNKNATGLRDRTTGLFAMRDEKQESK